VKPVGQNKKKTINLKRIQYQPVLFVLNLLQEAKIMSSGWKFTTESCDLFGLYCDEIQEFVSIMTYFLEGRIFFLFLQPLLGRLRTIIEKSHVADGKSRVAEVKSRVAEVKSRVVEVKSHAADEKSRAADEKNRPAEQKKYRSLCVLLEVYKTGPKIPYSDYALYLFIGIVSVLCQLYFCKSNFLLYIIKLLVYDWNFYSNVFSSYFVSYRSLLCCITKSFLAWCPEC
jgi:hypothetical protein